ncbi:MAG: phage tail protein [Patescibacteria group bacterium]|nr:phage tail protein [Patescibacteria group bacterium]
MSQTVLNDLYHYWGNDLTVANSGDFLTAQTLIRSQQRVLRRLLTNPGDYVFQPSYGAGLPQWIGQPLDVAKLTALIVSQMQLEDSVAQSPAPTVALTQPDSSTISVTVNYTEAATNTPVVLSFNVSN